MEDWTKRFALAALLAFFAGLFALPLSCGGLVLRNEHVYGDVERGGPEALLGGMGISLCVAVLVFVLVWRKSRPR
jgi:hypothetical protein